MKKRISGFLFCSGLGVLGILFAAGQPDHKIDWCHFPPGQWTGDVSGSKYQILSIDVAADGSLIDGQHLNHQGDGPVSTLGSTCGTENESTGVRHCGTALGDLVGPDGTLILQYPGPVQLVPGPNPGECLCPPGSLTEGQLPGGTGSQKNCGGRG